MTSDRAIVVSDVHLGATTPEQERAFLQFLGSWRGAAHEIFFNGDLFDFWFEYRSVILSRYFPVLRVLADLAASGVRLRLLGGNHDAWGGGFLRDVIGIELLDGPVRLDLRGWRVWAAHGDGVGEGDLGYRLLKSLVRRRALVAAFRWTHPDLGERIARRVSKTGRPSAADLERSRARARVLGAYARAVLARDPSIDVVLLGHCHIPELVELHPRRYYLNAGDWVTHRSYAVFTPDRVELKEWTP
ncbi:MAG: UDP-2,3-diacylglucosamine diphosphatase [Gemmatimonadetes bacterium]|nr:UDP-2,3-diacylglucosamine diphosphatase [Gemmatimonadota bacterium]